MAWKAAVAALLIVVAPSPAFSWNLGSSQTAVPSASLVSGWDEPSEWHTYRNTEYGFRIDYPSSLHVASDPDALATEGAVVTFIPAGDPSIDGTGAKTNLIRFSVTIGVTNRSAASSQGTSCPLADPGHGFDDRESGRMRFKRHHTAEGAVGNRYEKLSYLSHRGDRCYEIALFVHSGNPGCYPPGGVTIFDPTGMTRLLETMVCTFETAG